MSKPIIDVAPDCGNSPRRKFIKEFNTAIASGDSETISRSVSPQTVFQIAGKKEIIGAEKILKAFEKTPMWKLKRLSIETIITHGRDASSSGSFISTRDEFFAYSQVFKFNSAGGSQIKSVRIYLIKLKKNQS
ncbi:hypothetical protein [Pollutibacter soli]|uniref:hypothetical protein n=1 Tax=Pollutibacter soli TaxID=3034157 RepID=UPI003013E098